MTTFADLMALMLTFFVLLLSMSTTNVKKYEEAKNAFERNPVDTDALIWYGRRAAYLGDYRQAIEIYTGGSRSIRRMPGSTATAATATSRCESSAGPSQTSSGPPN